MICKTYFPGGKGKIQAAKGGTCYCSPSLRICLAAVCFKFPREGKRGATTFKTNGYEKEEPKMNTEISCEVKHVEICLLQSHIRVFCMEIK